jgi:hypothetical protein
MVLLNKFTCMKIEMILFCIAFFVVSFNYNLPILTKPYQGVSRHRFREWLFLGYTGRVVVAAIFTWLYASVSGTEPVLVAVGWSVLLAVIFIANLLFTRYEILRDQHNHHASGIFDQYYRIPALDPRSYESTARELLASAFVELYHEISTRLSRIARKAHI